MNGIFDGRRVVKDFEFHKPLLSDYTLLFETSYSNNASSVSVMK